MKRIWKTASSWFSRGEKEVLSRAEAVFDREFYLETNEDVRRSGMNPWRHFLGHGWQEGRNPHPLFDVKWYLDCNADVAIGGTNPFEHFVYYGWREGRQPVRGFVCDRLAFLEEDEKGNRFNPLDYLVSANGDFHDWSDRIRKVAETDRNEAIQLCSVWKRKSEGSEALPCIRLGELLAAHGEFGEAASEFEEALILDPAAVEAMYSLAECAIKDGDWPRFNEAFERLTQSESLMLEGPGATSRGARLNAFHWLAADRLLESCASFDQFAAADPGDGLAFFGRGLVLTKLGSGDEAFADFWRALRINGNWKHVKELMGRLWADLNEVEDAGAALAEFPDPEKWVEEDLENLVSGADFAGEGTDQNSAAQRLKGHVMFARGDFESALEQFAFLTEAGFREREARLMLARIYRTTGDSKAASAQLEILRNQEPEDRYLNLSVLESNDRQWGIKAVDDASNFRDLDSYELGKALALANHYRAAAACFKLGCSASASDAHSLSGLAHSLLQIGDFEEARDSALEALQIDPASGEANLVAGAVSRRFGNYRDAVTYYREAIKSGPQEPWVYRDLASEFDRSNDRNGAIEVLEAGRRIHRNDPGIDRDHDRLTWLNRLHEMSESMAREQSAGRSAAPEREKEFVALLRKFIDADWPVIGRDFAECRVFMDAVIRKGENWPLHMAYGDLLVRCGNKFDGIGYYEEAHRVAAAREEYGEVRPILLKIIANLEQLELYERCVSYLEQYIHGLSPSEAMPQYRRLACYSAMSGKLDLGHQYWSKILER